MQREMNEYTGKLYGIINKIKKDKKAVLIIAFALAGMLLILFSDSGKSDYQPVKNDNRTATAEVYENKLQNLISKIEGVGKVSVMITYESGEESVFAGNKEESYRNGEQKIKNEYIIVDGDNGETGLKVKSVYPKIKGVAVVCTGASDPIARERIITVVSALFDISTKNISVVSAEN